MLQTNITKVAGLESKLVGAQAACQAVTEAAQLVLGAMFALPEWRGSKPITTRLSRAPDQAKKLVKDSVELSIR